MWIRGGGGKTLIMWIIFFFFVTLPLKKEDIFIEPFEKKQIPQLKEVQVWELLTKLNSNKSTVKGDLPAKLYK